MQKQHGPDDILYLCLTPYTSFKTFQFKISYQMSDHSYIIQWIPSEASDMFLHLVYSKHLH